MELNELILPKISINSLLLSTINRSDSDDKDKKDGSGDGGDMGGLSNCFLVIDKSGVLSTSN
jgi:hypothetical protein